MAKQNVNESEEKNYLHPFDYNSDINWILKDITPLTKEKKLTSKSSYTIIQAYQQIVKLIKNKTELAKDTLAGNNEHYPELSNADKKAIETEIIRDKVKLADAKDNLKRYGEIHRELSKMESKEHNIDITKIKIQSPDYYKKYGKNIPTSFEKFLIRQNTPDNYEALNRLKDLAINSSDDFCKELLRYTEKQDPQLYLRVTGNRKIGREGYCREYFTEMVKKLELKPPKDSDENKAKTKSEINANDEVKNNEKRSGRKR